MDGNRYLDMSIGGIGANVLGYRDPDVDKAVLEAVLAGNSSSLNCPEEIELADLLCELHPWAEMVRYARTGGEAMAIAVRIARAHTGKDIIAFCGYHGWHDWYLAANLNSQAALDGHLLPGLNPKGVPRGLGGTAFPFHYNDLKALEVIVNDHGEDLAAIVMEPVRNKEPELGFLEGCKALAAQCKAVFIFDEISAAMRKNTGGAHLLYGVEPDIAVFSKGIGNGYAMAAVLGHADVMSAANHTFISSTYWTERIGPSAAIATLRKHREVDAGKKLMALGKAVQVGWADIGRRYGLELEIGGIPPLSHFVFKIENPLAARTYFVESMLELGYLASGNFYPMYAHSMEHVESYLSAADHSFAAIAEAAASGELEKRLKGGTASPGFKRLT